MRIIGITGTIGAGKGTVVDYLVDQKGFHHYSVRQYLIEEIKNRNMEVNRDCMVVVGNDLRAKNFPGYIVSQLYDRAKSAGHDCVIESIRTPGEVETLKEKGQFVLLAIDADPKVRYERIVERKNETDRIDFETFLQNEAREMSSSDPNNQNLSACIGMAQYVIYNDNTIEHLHQKIEEIINELE